MASAIMVRHFSGRFETPTASDARVAARRDWVSAGGYFEIVRLLMLAGFCLLLMIRQSPADQFTVTIEPVFRVTVQDQITQTTPPARYIQWPGWGTIDLQTYDRNCNCGMCQSIRIQQADYRAKLAAYEAAIRAPPEQVAASQAATPESVVEQTVEQLKLQPSDVLADLGCGDGRILIAAVKRYKCKAVGVEIDHVIAERARRKVKDSGLSGSIQIITGDAVEFDPGQHNVTAITAYLYPELLRKLLPKFRHDRVFVVATPYHEVPGLTMVRHGDVFVYRNPKKAKRREWYLVSESWCSACPAAKKRFRGLGWPEENILTIEQCRQRFGFKVPFVPYEFCDPVTN